MERLSPLLRYLLMLFLGASATLAFAPFNLPLFSLISVAGAYLLTSSEPKTGFVSGWSFGTGFFGAGTSWVFVSIYYHSDTPLLLAIILTLLFVTALGLLFAVQFWLYRKLFAGASAPGFIALWMLFEWLRSWFLTGFPWLYLGYAWIDTPVAALAPLGGVWLLSSLVALIAVLIGSAIKNRSTSPLALAIALFATTYLLPTNWTEPVGQSVKVALIQPNIPQALKWSPDQYLNNLDRLVQLSGQTEATWIVWPETAIPKLIDRAIYDIAHLLAELESRNQILISGFPMKTLDAKNNRWLYQNSMGVLTGTPSFYQKQRLVPFGEYLPFEQQLRGLIEFFDLPMSNFSPPLSAQAALEVGQYRLASAICYEIAYPELVRLQAKDSDLMITLSNDTWFSGSHAPDQHLQMARMRALENGRWLIRGTNNGLTAVVRPDGQIDSRLARDLAGILEAEIYPMQGQTPYQRAGILPAAAFNLSLLLLALIGRSRNRALKQTRTT